MRMPTSISAENMLLSFKSIFNTSTTSNTSKPLPSSQNPHKIIGDTLLEELEFQIRETEGHIREIQKQKNDSLGRPDYTWLMDIPKSYRLPQIVRLEIEEISKQIETEDVSSIIGDFRTAINKDIPVDKIASYLKFIVNHYVQNKKKQSKYKSEHYTQLLQMTDEAPQRSQSTAIIKQTNRTEDMYRPQSAPLSNNWKKRSKVFPVNMYGTKIQDCHIIELEDAVGMDYNENADRIISTSAV